MKFWIYFNTISDVNRNSIALIEPHIDDSIFISETLIVYDRLKEYGIDSFIAPEIASIEEWSKECESAMKALDFFIEECKPLFTLKGINYPALDREHILRSRFLAATGCQLLVRRLIETRGRPERLIVMSRIDQPGLETFLSDHGAAAIAQAAKREKIDVVHLSGTSKSVSDSLPIFRDEDVRSLQTEILPIKRRVRVGILGFQIYSQSSVVSALNSCGYEAVLYQYKTSDMRRLEEYHPNIVQRLIAVSPQKMLPYRKFFMESMARLRLRSSDNEEINSILQVACQQFFGFDNDFLAGLHWPRTAVCLHDTLDHIDRDEPDAVIVASLMRPEITGVALALRSRGIPTLSLPHASWPVPFNLNRYVTRWLSWSKFAADLVEEKTGPQPNLSVIGPLGLGKISKPSSEDVEAARRELERQGIAAGHRKVILVVSNFHTYGIVPVVDVDAHMDFMDVIANVPEDLRDEVQIVVKIRSKVESGFSYLDAARKFGTDHLFGVVGSGLVGDIVDAADLCVGFYAPSTGHIECVFRDKPVLFFGGRPVLDNESYNQQLLTDRYEITEDEESFWAIVRDVVRNPEASEKLRRKTRDWFTSDMPSHDVNERLRKSIEQAINTSDGDLER